ncbi:HD domain-containing protein [Calycomorphotria hydatis]|uniref:GTP pyrophosphokinase n=1 Tax=Calycomorphotria hydatis TaxID=2528027 RepID=A0A517TD35_9PLAN|nr:HD domain-containing protein [Calycomorphotria hydatis]QDT66291.1 GTP pyrophosphokinase [Calycomorphotria hydatis]
MLWPEIVERALRVAAYAHAEQKRKGGNLPYLYHPAAVAMILQRAGFTEPHVLAAAIMHDVIEDTPVTESDLRAEFPAEVVDWVCDLSEQKDDEQGRERSWKDRKEDQYQHIKHACLEVRAIKLADKLHNLQSMRYDAASGTMNWDRFNAPLDAILDFAVRMAEAAAADDAELAGLKTEVLSVIEELRGAAE